MLRLRFVPLLWCACVTAGGSVRERATRLEAEAERCESFATFEPALAKERDALVATAPGEDLVPASQSLSKARARCAATTIDGLFERQQDKGRSAAVTEVNALTRALGPDETTRLLRAKWGHDADGFLAEVMLSGFAPGPTPDQPAPKEPIAPKRDTPTLPGDEHFGEGASCLRRPTVEAAACLAEWRREDAKAQELEAAVRALVARVQKEEKVLEDDARATLLGDVLRALALPREYVALTPLFDDLGRMTDRLMVRAEALRSAGKGEAAAVVVRPLLLVDESRRRVEPFVQAASRRHTQLALDAKSLHLAAQVHRYLAAWFLGTDAPIPSLEPGQWSAAQWVCQLPKPTLPPLDDGVSARIVARCRELPKTETQQPVDPSMRTFEMEASLPRVRIDADVSVTCGGKTLSEHLTADELVIDTSTTALDDTRPHRLDGPLRTLLGKAAKECREQTRREVELDCARLPPTSLELTQTFTRHALRLGEWPACYARWFAGMYGRPPPPLRRSPGVLSSPR
ncbi:MAG: hypothetical protein Q8N26_05460 [Myxococcales bacterium]|nr:hypothetical protein [Myxococcales bacterium]